MRVIYLVRAAQLLVTLRALWMLYSVSTFCEKTKHTMKACSDMIARIPLATPEQIAEHERIKHQRPASNRVKTTSDASTTMPIPHSSTAPATTERSTVTPSTTVTSSEEVKSRQKREERRELPGNGMTEAQRKAAAAAVPKKEEEKKVEKKEEQKVEETTTVPSKKEEKEEKKEEQKKEEVKVESTTPSEVKKEDKKEHIDEKKEKSVEKKEDQKPVPVKVNKTEVKAEEKKGVSVETTTAKPLKKEVKEHQGAKVEIPVASTPKKEEQHTEKPVVSKEEDPAPFSSEDKHHTVKKDLKAHVQEPVKVETTKESTTRAPKLAPAQQRFVLEHSDAFLQEIRCLELTSDDYFGKEISPFAVHLKGLAFVGPVLVVVTIYLVCSVLRTRLCAEPPNEFTDMLGCVFHLGMWLVVGLSMVFIADHWTQNWQSVSADTFLPEFPCSWFNLILLSSLMVLTTSIEVWFHKQLYCEIVFERSYRTYEVIESNDAAQNDGTFSRTNKTRKQNIYDCIMGLSQLIKMAIAPNRKEISIQCPLCQVKWFSTHEGMQEHIRNYCAPNIPSKQTSKPAPAPFVLMSMRHLAEKDMHLQSSAPIGIQSDLSRCLSMFYASSSAFRYPPQPARSSNYNYTPFMSPKAVPANLRLDETIRLTDAAYSGGFAKEIRLGTTNSTFNDAGTGCIGIVKREDEEESFPSGANANCAIDSNGGKNEDDLDRTYPCLSSANAADQEGEGEEYDPDRTIPYRLGTGNNIVDDVANRGDEHDSTQDHYCLVKQAREFLSNPKPLGSLIPTASIKEEVFDEETSVSSFSAMEDVDSANFVFRPLGSSTPKPSDSDAVKLKFESDTSFSNAETDSVGCTEQVEKCASCGMADRDVLFIPCAHFKYCENCALRIAVITNGRCPFHHDGDGTATIQEIRNICEKSDPARPVKLAVYKKEKGKSSQMCRIFPDVLPVDYTRATFQKTGKDQLWYFILQLLGDATKKSIVVWTGKQRQFRIKDSAMLCRLWSDHNGRVHNIQWESLRRTMRSCGASGILMAVPSTKHKGMNEEGVFGYVIEPSFYINMTVDELDTFIAVHCEDASPTLQHSQPFPRYSPY